MQLKGKSIEQFFSIPQIDTRVVVLFGTDTGKIKDYVSRYTKSLVENISINRQLFESKDIIATEGKGEFLDFLKNFSFLGEKNLFIIRNADDKLTKLMAEIEGVKFSDSYLVVEAIGLNARSKLIQWAIKSDKAVAVGCYNDEGMDLGRFITNYVGELGYKIEANAVSLMLSFLGNDREITKREIEKLVIFHNDVNTPITSKVMELVVGNNLQFSFDSFFTPILLGDMVSFNKNWSKAIIEFGGAIAILRIMQKQILKLIKVQSAMASGISFEEVIKKQNIMLNFKTEPDFRKQLNLWDMNRLNKGLELLYRAELDCKTSFDSNLICNRVLTVLMAMVKNVNSR